MTQNNNKVLPNCCYTAVHMIICLPVLINLSTVYFNKPKAIAQMFICALTFAVYIILDCFAIKKLIVSDLITPRFFYVNVVYDLICISCSVFAGIILPIVMAILTETEMAELFICLLYSIIPLILSGILLCKRIKEYEHLTGESIRNNKKILLTILSFIPILNFFSLVYAMVFTNKKELHKINKRKTIFKWLGIVLSTQAFSILLIVITLSTEVSSPLPGHIAEIPLLIGLAMLLYGAPIIGNLSLYKK